MSDNLEESVHFPVKISSSTQSIKYTDSNLPDCTYTTVDTEYVMNCNCSKIKMYVIQTTDASHERTMRSARHYVRDVITLQRRGKSEWGGGQDAMALLALQLSEPDWCFQGLDNQRSVDRLEIHLLAAISR